MNIKTIKNKIKSIGNGNWAYFKSASSKNYSRNSIRKSKKSVEKHVVFDEIWDLRYQIDELKKHLRDTHQMSDEEIADEMC